MNNIFYSFISFYRKNRIFFSFFLFISIVVILSSCKKDTTSIVETGIVTDIDGNVYQTVKIGNQWWMVENLKTKRYRNGDSIAFVAEKGFYLDSAKWNHLSSGAYCIIDNSDSSSQNFQGKLFGYLYNWYAVSDVRNIAPVGWHIPSDMEWKVLEEYLGMNAIDADKMNWRGTTQANKLKIYSGWNKPADIYTSWGTNESGFSAKGGGCCMYNGIWGDPRTFTSGFWWTSSLIYDKPLYRYLDYNKSNIFRYFGPKTYGFSIRCIKD